MEQLLGKILKFIHKLGFTVPSLGLAITLMVQCGFLLFKQYRWSIWLNLGLIGITLISTLGYQGWKYLKGKLKKITQD